MKDRTGSIAYVRVGQGPRHPSSSHMSKAYDDDPSYLPMGGTGRKRIAPVLICFPQYSHSRHRSHTKATRHSF